MDEEHLLSVAAVSEKYRTAAKILNGAMQLVISGCRVRAKIFDICKRGDEHIETQCKNEFKDKKITRGVAFPTSISINHIIRHFSPSANNPSDFNENDVIKIEMGCHFDGFVVLVAHTHVLVLSDDNDIPEKTANLLAATDTAAEVAYQLVKPGKKSNGLIKSLRMVAHTFGCRLVDGVCVHQLKKSVIEEGNKISSNPETIMNDVVFADNEVYAIDIVMSTGQGKEQLDGDHETTIFKKTDKNVDTPNPSRDYVSALNQIEENFPTMPFPARGLKTLKTKSQKRVLLQLVNEDKLETYPVFCESRHGVFVARIKFTVLLASGQSERLTKYPLQNLKHKSVDDSAIRELIDFESGKKKREPLDIRITPIDDESKPNIEMFGDQQVKRQWVGYDISVRHVQGLVYIDHPNLLNLKHISEDRSAVYTEFPESLQNIKEHYGLNARLTTYTCTNKLEHHYLPVEIQSLVKILWGLLKYMHDMDVYTIRPWNRNDDIMIDKRLCPKLLVPLEKIAPTEKRKTEDVTYLGDWLAGFFSDDGQQRLPEELNHLIRLLRTGNITNYPILSHPTLLSHGARGNNLFRISRNMRALGGINYTNFTNDLHNDVIFKSTLFKKKKGQKADWRNEIEADNILSLIKPHALSEDGSRKKYFNDNFSLVRFMGNTIAHIVAESYDANLGVLDDIDVDCWISATFKMVLVRLMDMLQNRNCLGKLVDVTKI